MASEHSNPYYDLGYTTPDEAQELRRVRLEKTARAVVGGTAGESARHSRRVRAAMGPQYGEEATVGYPDGRPEDQQYQPLSPEQAALNHRFARDWRKIGEEAIRDGTHGVDANDEPS